MQLQDIQNSRQLKQGKYFKGIVDFSQKVKNYAKIFSKQIQGDIIAQGYHKNRCLHGDQVYFKLLTKSQLPPDIQKDGLNQKIRCKVVYIFPWKNNPLQKRKIVGKLQFTSKNKTYYLIPINKRLFSFDIRFSDIKKQNLKKKQQKYFLAEFTEWPIYQQFPQCKVISQYGQIGNIQTQTSALLISNGVQDKQYDQEVINQGLSKFLLNRDENGQYKIQQQQIKKRSDLRNQRIFTIDPLTARDFDDALSIQQCGFNIKNQKIYQVGVHIADTSFFVQQGGLIDQHAQKTTTSVYLVHRVLPMLPRVLCETMCSLNPGLQRLTLSIWFKITQNGQILQGSRYDRSVIKSKARFTYQQAQKIIKQQIHSQSQIQPGFGCINQKDYTQISNDIKIMNKIAVKIRKNRIDGGSLVFQTAKKSFKLDTNFLPQSFSVAKRFQAHYLVEQYMLLANKKVGQVLVQNIRSSALLRKHSYPTQKKIQRFQQFSKKVNYPIKINKQIPIQQQMNQIINNSKVKQCIKDVLNYQMIFLLQQAQYFVVGKKPQQQWIHYALNMPIYTHFTSPIRRYPDIIVHRQLISIIQAKKKNQSIIIPNYQKLSALIQTCNRNKMNAKKVSSGCQKIFMCLYLKNNPVFCKAVLTDINQYCLTVCVPSYDFRTQIQFKQLKKTKTLQFSKDSKQRKYIQIQYEQESKTKVKTILKQMQQINVRLSAKQGFPIDYLVRLVFPDQKYPQKKVICS